jgi:1,4-alpha-glucan branching enzyme
MVEGELEVRKIALAMAILLDLAVMGGAGRVLFSQVRNAQKQLVDSTLILPTKPVNRQVVIFKLMAKKADKVQILGDFTNWMPRELTSRKNHMWSIAIGLSPGTYRYNFIVNGLGILDPNNPHTASDGNNSVVTVRED